MAANNPARSVWSASAFARNSSFVPSNSVLPLQSRKTREETAVIISTHILEEVDAVCSRVFLLCRGRTLFDGTKDEFRAKADTLHTDLAGLFAAMTEGEQA